MKVLIFLAVLQFAGSLQAQEVKAVVASFSSVRMSKYQIEKECFKPDPQSKKTVCNDPGYGYYVAVFKPISSEQSPPKISVVYLSHNKKLYKSKNFWLLQLRPLDSMQQNLLGAEYELVGFALLNAKRCSVKPISTALWLYLPKNEVLEGTNVKNEFCYSAKPLS